MTLKLKPLVCLLTCSLLLAVLAGCKKQPYLATVTQTPYLGLPASVEQVHSLDVARLRNRDGFLDLMHNAEDKDPEMKGFMTALRDRVGFDPLQQIDQCVMGLTPATAATRTQPWRNLIVIARGRFDQPADKLEKLHGWLAEQALVAPPPFKQVTDPATGFTKFQTAAQSQFNESVVVELNFAFPSPTMMVFTCNKGLLDETLAVIAGATPSLQKDQFWMAMLKRPNLGAMLWGTGKLPADLPAQDAMVALAKAKQYYYSVDMLQDFKAEAALVCNSIDDATNLTNGIKGGLAQMTPLLTLQFGRIAPQTLKQLAKIVITNELETARILVQLSADERRALLEEWDHIVQQGKSGQLPLPPGLTPPGLSVAPRPAAPASGAK